ncbi:MAG TPA: hypothetical protein P5517_03250 [Candidatus Saccharicenans sp.]|nr:hypothetical protein [Candidatus Saccharicenans sp.]HQE64079.1 hypothetical protein [Candidatus Saccharicenans sp.]HQH60704.1 hypothetical protein [Candidatus Saccharicenans sp.]HRT25424.1 hypothetical protein [Candidatus Saccharicenans sp.]HRV05889.1 hypothetical protein [Candidatus Saccharicenans sp.]
MKKLRDERLEKNQRISGPGVDWWIGDAFLPLILDKPVGRIDSLKIY